MEPNTLEVPETHKLQEILHKCIRQSVTEFKKLHKKKKAKFAPVSSIRGFKSQDLSKKGKNHVAVEGLVSFTMEGNPNVSSFRDIEKVWDKLKNWKLQCRRRSDKNQCDTYYYHSTVKGQLRSITDIVNHILPDGYAKRPKQKKSKKHNPNEQEVDQADVQHPKVAKRLSFDLNVSLDENEDQADVQHPKVAKRLSFDLNVSLDENDI